MKVQSSYQSSIQKPRMSQPPAYPQTAGAYPNDFAVTADVNLVVAANTSSLPIWNARIAAALGRETPMLMDFNTITAATTDIPQRVKIVTTLVARSGGLISDVEPAAENVVRAIEECCLDSIVKAEVLAKASCIRFTNLINAPAESKSLELVNGEIVYSGNFLHGHKATFTKKEIKMFFEQQFYARERFLVSMFTSTILPQAQQRIANALQNPHFVLDFDVVGILGQCSKQLERLPTSEFIVSRSGTGKAANSMYHKAALGFNNTAAAIEKGIMNTNAGFKVEDNVDTSGENFTSPNVLQPLVDAIEFLCQDCSTNVQGLSEAISKIKFVASSQPKDIYLSQSDEKPQRINATVGVPTSLKGGCIMYQGNFEARNSYGVFSNIEFIEFLEQHFRCQEQKHVMALLQVSLPSFNSRIQAIIAPTAQVEIIWSTLFQPADDSERRLDVAETICIRNSANTVKPLVEALEKINGEAPGLLGQRVSKIAIQGVHGNLTKPYLQWGPASAGPGSPSILIYYVAIDRNLHGCFSFNESKKALRNLFGLQTPPDEVGVAGVLHDIGDDLTKVSFEMGDKMSKAWDKFGFGGKKAKPAKK
eukprot:m.124036 g.124036  ORF g.124036 m.124036 type:complete len:592 (-) comp29034_c1_seq2:200-1975(-)